MRVEASAIFQASFVVLHVAAALIHAFLWQDRTLGGCGGDDLPRRNPMHSASRFPPTWTIERTQQCDLYLGGGRQTSVLLRGLNGRSPGR
jgi:hypothetical protein